MQRFRVRDVAISFATRGAAREVVSVIESSLHNGPQDIIDWTGVKSMSASFADELVGHLSRSLPEVTFVGVHHELVGLFAKVIKRRRASIRIASDTIVEVTTGQSGLTFENSTNSVGAWATGQVGLVEVR